MSRVVSIRAQLKKYMQRFNLPLESCQGDAKRLRRCLVSGYWRNGAQWMADGTYRSVRGNKVRRVHRVAILKTNISGPECSSDFGPVYEKTSFWLGHLSRNGGDQKDSVSYLVLEPHRHCTELD